MTKRSPFNAGQSRPGALPLSAILHRNPLGFRTVLRVFCPGIWGRHWGFIPALIIMVLCLSPAHAQGQDSSKPVCLENFGQVLCGNFRVMPGVIVKSALTKEQIGALFQRKVQQIAFLSGSNLYLVASENALEDARQFAAIPGVEYAQPDISQARAQAGQPALPAQHDVVDLRSLWQGGKGKGVKVAIIDDGFNLQHPDLQGVHVGFAYDADNKTPGAQPLSRLDRHGTRVAGILFAQHNSIGVDGVAPEATLIPIRQTGTRTSDTVLSFTVADMSGADIINCSWNSQTLMQPVRDVIEHLAKRGRGGRGSVIVFAAGNEGEVLRPGSREAAMPSVISVGALAGKEIAPYSNRGEVVDIYLPGRLRTTLQRGYGVFNGTSASAALASGLAALVLSRNPQLSAEAVSKELVVSAARLWPDAATAVARLRGGA